MQKCLSALHIFNGASHGEIIMCHDGPCLVEVGARMHGLKGPQMTQMATGKTCRCNLKQRDYLISAYNATLYNNGF